MSLPYTFKDFDPKSCLLIIQNFRFKDFSFALRRQQNSNSGGEKTSTYIDNVHFTLHPWVRLVDTNINAKGHQI